MERVMVDVCVCKACLLCGGGELLQTVRAVKELQEQTGQDSSFKVGTYLPHQHGVYPVYPQVMVQRRLLRAGEIKEIWDTVTEQMPV